MAKYGLHAKIVRGSHPYDITPIFMDDKTKSSEKINSLLNVVL